MDKAKQKKCSICHRPYTGFGNNAWPINDGRCCDKCNTLVVIPARIADLYASTSKVHK